MDFIHDMVGLTPLAMLCALIVQAFVIVLLLVRSHLARPFQKQAVARVYWDRKSGRWFFVIKTKYGKELAQSRAIGFQKGWHARNAAMRIGNLRVKIEN